MVRSLPTGGSLRGLTRSRDVFCFTVVQIPSLVTNGQGIECQRPVQVEEVIESGVPIEVTVVWVQLVSFVRPIGTYGLDV